MILPLLDWLAPGQVGNQVSFQSAKPQVHLKEKFWCAWKQWERSKIRVAKKKAPLLTFKVSRKLHTSKLKRRRLSVQRGNLVPSISKCRMPYRNSRRHLSISRHRCRSSSISPTTVTSYRMKVIEKTVSQPTSKSNQSMLPLAILTRQMGCSRKGILLSNLLKCKKTSMKTIQTTVAELCRNNLRHSWIRWMRLRRSNRNWNTSWNRWLRKLTKK